MAALGPDGRFELREQIGQSPRSTVHRAMDQRRKVPVTIKQLDPAKAPPAAVGKYADSVAALRKSSVAAVVLPLEIVAQDPGPYVVYQPLEGQSLENALRDGPLLWARAAEVVAAIATILAAVATAAGQTHRALKPTNVWLAPDGRVLLLDFGVVALGQSGPMRRDNTWLEYRAPEQLDGSPGDARADVFSLAVLLFELTCGAHPFSGATAYQAAQKLSQTPPDLADMIRGMSTSGAREVTKLMTQALASEPEDRPADPAAFSTLLAYVRPIVGSPTAPKPARAEPEPAPPPKPADPSALQSLPQLRQLLVQRSAEAVAATPVIATPVAPPAPPATSAPPAAPPTPPATSTAPASSAEPPQSAPPPATPASEAPRSAVPHPASRPQSVPTASRESSSRPMTAAPASRPSSAPLNPREHLAPAPDEPPTLVGFTDDPAAPAPARPAPAPAPTAPVREEHTMIERPPPAAPPREDRTVVDYAMPTAVPRPQAQAPGRGEKTEILKASDVEDDEENRPTVALIREPMPKPGEATLMLTDQTLPEPPPAAGDKPTGPAPPSAKVQWTLIAVNAIVVLIVLAVLVVTYVL